MAVFAGCCCTQTQTVRRAAAATVSCKYPKRERSQNLFFCKENDVTCEEILGTQSSKKTNGSFTLEKTSGGFNIFISRVSSRDNGVYWCAEKHLAVRAAFQMISIQVEDEESSTGETAGVRHTAGCFSHMTLHRLSSAAHTHPTGASTVRPVEKDPATKGCHGNIYKHTVYVCWSKAGWNQPTSLLSPAEESMIMHHSDLCSFQASPGSLRSLRQSPVERCCCCCCCSSTDVRRFPTCSRSVSADLSQTWVDTDPSSLLDKQHFSCIKLQNTRIWLFTDPNPTLHDSISPTSRLHGYSGSLFP